MEADTKANGTMIKCKAMDALFIQMETFLKGSGKKTNTMAQALKLLSTDKFLQALLIWVNEMAEGLFNTSTQREPPQKETTQR